MTAESGFYVHIYIITSIIISANLKTNLNIVSYINKLTCNGGRKSGDKTPDYKEINPARIRTI